MGHNTTSVREYARKFAHLPPAVTPLLSPLVSKGPEGGNLLRVNEALKNVSDARFIIGLGAQSGLHDAVHVSVVLDVETAKIHPLLRGTSVLFLRPHFIFRSLRLKVDDTARSKLSLVDNLMGFARVDNE